MTVTHEINWLYRSRPARGTIIINSEDAAKMLEDPNLGMLATLQGCDVKIVKAQSPNGKAEVCNTSIVGSIPTCASKE